MPGPCSPGRWGQTEGQGLLWVGSALLPPKESPVPWEQSGPKALLVEALLAINGRLIIQALGDERKRERKRERERWIVEHRVS